MTEAALKTEIRELAPARRFEVADLDVQPKELRYVAHCSVLRRLLICFVLLFR